jgi:hypothetical protein
VITDNIKNYLLQFEKILLNRSTLTDKIITLKDFIDFSKEDIKSVYSSAGAVQKIMRKKQWFLPLYERATIPFDSGKIVVNTKNMDVFTYSETDLYSSGGGAGGQNFIYPKNDSVLIKSIKKNTKINSFIAYTNAILNSRLISFIISSGQFNQLSTSKIADLPIRLIDLNNNEEKVIYNSFTINIDLLKNYNDELNNLIIKFSTYLNFQFQYDVLIKDWYTLEFSEFIKEINKDIKSNKQEKLTKLQEMEWMEVFEVKKAEAQTLKTQITQTDKEIDAMVYELYGLTEDEIKIVENS